MRLCRGKDDVWRQGDRRGSASPSAALRAKRPLGRRELKPHADRADGRPATEPDFKLHRQATDKIVGLSDAAAAFLETFF